MKVLQNLRSVSLLLLAAMLFMASGVNFLHDHGHSHDHSVSHSMEDEADACHRSIYHGDLDLGCQHENHVHRSESHCQLCDLISSRHDQVLPEAGSLISFDAVGAQTSAILRSHAYILAYEHGKRGPPQV